MSSWGGHCALRHLSSEPRHHHLRDARVRVHCSPRSSTTLLVAAALHPTRCGYQQPFNVVPLLRPRLNADSPFRCIRHGRPAAPCPSPALAAVVRHRIVAEVLRDGSGSPAPSPHDKIAHSPLQQQARDSLAASTRPHGTRAQIGRLPLHAWLTLSCDRSRKRQGGTLQSTTAPHRTARYRNPVRRRLHLSINQSILQSINMHARRGRPQARLRAAASVTVPQADLTARRVLTGFASAVCCECKCDSTISPDHPHFATWPRHRLVLFALCAATELLRRSASGGTYRPGSWVSWRYLNSPPCLRRLDRSLNHAVGSSACDGP